MTKLKIELVNQNCKAPERANEGDLYDLFANGNYVINSFQPTIVKLGVKFEIPEGYRIKIFSRSSLPLKKNLLISNGIAIIDTFYRGEVGIILHTVPSYSSTDHKTLINREAIIMDGEKIAQFQLEKIEDVELELVDKIDTTNDRGGGFGSTKGYK